MAVSVALPPACPTPAPAQASAKPAATAQAVATLLPSHIPENAPEHCPGTESEQAGLAPGCAGCPNQDACSTAPKGPDPDLAAVQDRLKDVKNKILVLSGKGGVGKSTVSAMLGWALSEGEEGENDTGLMDVDICGPSLPLLFGMQGQRLHSTSSGILPLSITSALSLVSIGFLLPSSNSAVIWRGPKKNGLIKQFLKDVEWGQLENLVIDTPPGTSDEHLSIVQYLAAAGGVDGAVIVTTPQEVALQDVRKELDFCAKVGVPVLGVVENMSGFVCPSCGGESDIFIPSTGGALGLADEWGIEVLGKVPLDPRIGKSGDYGQSFLEEYPDSPASVAYRSIVKRIKEKLADKSASLLVRPK
ncbi:cytosolic Fe-S cluster assembly factor nbp35 [Rhodotorula mucilaginosa]|uniref:Cytosolic Fe-S cluster assembly factor nbp35 n=1 Tax=Rhodotorula mucilaginosa TaxID=5537 RepID=A0A9P6W0Q3_RHOMI|nr:cytosolic Fe-S cluster assembly factor nbp35 [Rhodotorula mucilaginosa]TKA51994.1 Cytosolic Fe-S cluster assembly factor NBP35 [Rhodotorula sp. CCFEE 5036]